MSFAMLHGSERALKCFLVQFTCLNSLIGEAFCRIIGNVVFH